MVSPRSSVHLSDQAAVHNNGPARIADNNGSNQGQSQSAQEQNGPLMENDKRHSPQNSKNGRIGMSKFGFLKPWWMEVIACALVLLSTMAIVLTLALHQNQPLPNWPFSISVNSLVSIFVVILKGGMLLILGEGFQQHRFIC